MPLRITWWNTSKRSSLHYPGAWIKMTFVMFSRLTISIAVTNCELRWLESLERPKNKHRKNYRRLCRCHLHRNVLPTLAGIRVKWERRMRRNSNSQSRRLRVRSPQHHHKQCRQDNNNKIKRARAALESARAKRKKSRWFSPLKGTELKLVN